MLSDSHLLRWLKWGYTLLFALLPFSLPVSLGRHQLEIPSEPLLAILSVLLLTYFYRHGWWKHSFYRSPLTLASMGFIGWMIICIPFSSAPFVSLKYVLVAVTHWWVFYHGLMVVLPNKEADFRILLDKYTIGFVILVLYAWTVHAQYDFRIDASVLAARPFYFDHAMYGTVMLLLLAHYSPFKLFFNKKDKAWPDWLSSLAGIILLIGVYLSFSRAAWLSAILALVLVLAIWLLKLRFKHLMLLSGLVIVGIILTTSTLQEQLNKNRVASKQGSAWEQLISAANISTDVSNLERLNRYSCALRMTTDRPWTGFGPGSFQEAYLPYQQVHQMTRISVTTSGPHRAGKGGGAHSEYLQAFAEMGLTGGSLWLSLVIAMLWTALCAYHQASIKADKAMILILLFGLTTFFVHGLFNNFLHHNKVAVLVWISLAMLNDYWNRFYKSATL